MVKLEIFARNHIIPNQRLVFTPRMRDLLFIMVCRHFAYGGTINKILPFQQEIENLLADHTPFDAILFKRLHGLLTPFRLPAIPYNTFYDPNQLPTYNENYCIMSIAVLICSTGFQLSKLANIPILPRQSSPSSPRTNFYFLPSW